MKGQEDRIRPEILRLALILSVLATLPHALHLPLLISLFFVFLVIWRFASLSWPRLIPGRLFLVLLTIIGILLVYSQHQTLLGRDAGVSLLTIMLTLKLMELRKRRDIYVICFMGYFIIVTQFLFSQSFLLTLYLIGTVLCITALLLEINRVTPSRRLIEPLKATLVISLQGIPIAAVLFLLFPRINQPLWQFGSGDGSGLTGLDERVSPGSISQLIQSTSVAFRVNFFGPPPPPEDRYWRGLVLWDTNGFDWFNKTATKPGGRSPALTETGQQFSYQIQLEPHFKKWLFSLDLPVSVPVGSKMTADYLLISDQPVSQIRQYRTLSYTRYTTEQPVKAALIRALELSDNVTQRQVDLVQNWQSRAENDRQIVSLALQHFNVQPYVYTLTPPLYETNPVDQFLFEGLEGFCEHYASSFTQLMRIAGIPTRMVIGYQGGEFNPMGDYFIIRQSDAHAWSEVWLDDQGWTRVDPTAAVAPERVRHAIQLDFTGTGSPALFRIDSGGILTNVFNRAGLILDAANLSWRHWIIGYNRDRQFNFLNNIGLNFTQTWEWASLMFSIIGVCLLIITATITLKGRSKQPSVVTSYQKLCRKLARIGLPRKPSEGPLDYSKRVANIRPDLSAQSQKLFGIYIRLRYAETAQSPTIQQFQRLVRDFRPKKFTG